MALQHQERVTAGFVTSAIISVVGILVRLNATAMAATPARGGSTIYPTEKINSYVQIGFTLLVFGLVLAAITFNYWLSSQYVLEEQEEKTESLENNKGQNRASIW